MRGQSYRITATTLGILSVEGNRASLTIPIGATVRVIDGPLDGNRLVDVTWGSTELMMFTQDLRDRAVPIHHSSAEAVQARAIAASAN